MNHLRQLGSQTNNIVGIELLNEPNPPSDRVLQSWYTSAITLKIPQSQSTLVNVGELNHTLITSLTIVQPHHLLFLTITSTVVSLLPTSTPQSRITLTLCVTIPLLYLGCSPLSLRNLGEQAVVLSLESGQERLILVHFNNREQNLRGEGSLWVRSWRYLTSIAVDGSFGRIRRNTEEIQIGAGKMQLREVYSLHRWVSSTDGWKQTISWEGWTFVMNLEMMHLVIYFPLYHPPYYI